MVPPSRAAGGEDHEADEREREPAVADRSMRVSVVAQEYRREKDARRRNHRREVQRRRLPEIAAPLDLEPVDEPGRCGECRRTQADDERDPPRIRGVPLDDVHDVEDRGDRGERVGADRAVDEEMWRGLIGASLGADLVPGIRCKTRGCFDRDAPCRIAVRLDGDDPNTCPLTC